MKIDLIRIQNLSPIGPQEIGVSDINVLFGANGSGKSSLLAAIYSTLTRPWRPHLDLRGTVTLQFSEPRSTGMDGQANAEGTIAPSLLNSLFAEMNDQNGFLSEDSDKVRKHFAKNHVETFLARLASSATPSRTGLFRENFAHVLREDASRYATLLRSLLSDCRFNLSVDEFSDEDSLPYTWSLTGLIDPATFDQFFTADEMVAIETIERLKWPQFVTHDFLVFERDDTAGLGVIGRARPHLLVREDGLTEVPLVCSSMLGLPGRGWGPFPAVLREVLPGALVLNNELVVTLQGRLNVAVSNIGKLIAEVNRPGEGPGLSEDMRFRERYFFNELNYDDSRRHDASLPSGVLPWTQESDASFASQYVQAARLIGSLASELRPDFLLDGSIEVRLAHRAGEQALVYLGGQELHELPEGHRTWVAYCVAIASIALANGIAWRPLEQSELDVPDWQRSCLQPSSPIDENTETVVDPDFNLVMCIDEVESHLYPRYMTSIGQWAESIAKELREATQFIATHDFDFVDLSEPWATRLFLDWRNRSMDGSDFRTEIKRFGQGEYLQYERSPDEFYGMSRARFFMRTRLLLFVEGDRDKVMIETWFPLELQAHGIHVISMDGLNNESSLVPFYEELLSAIDMPFFVLTDRRKRRESTDSGGDIDRLLKATTSFRSAEDGAIRAGHAAIREEDGLYLICDAAYEFFADRARESAPELKPWPGLKATWLGLGQEIRSGKSAGRAWKSSLLPTYGVDVSPTGLIPILKWAKKHCGVPEELTKILQDIIALSKRIDGLMI